MTKATDVLAEVQGPRRFSLRFSARDLLRVAIFVVIFIVVEYVIGMLGILAPLVYVVIMPISAVINGITFMLFVSRVRHAGMVTLFAVVLALFFTLDGNTLISTAMIIVVGVLAEVILWSGRYRSTWAAIVSYAVFALCYFSPFLPMFIDPDRYLDHGAWAQMGDTYLTAAKALLTGPVLSVLALGILVAGFLGGLLGSAILRKHFVRAGLA